MKTNLHSKKICHVSSVHSCFDTRIFHRECKTLKDNDYQVTVIGQGGWIESYPQTEDIRIEYVKGIKVISFSPPDNRFRRILFQIKLFNLAKFEKAEIYHFHDPELIPLGILVKFITRAKIVYDVHENYSLLSRSWIPQSLRRVATYILNRFMKLSFNYFDGMIVATDTIGQKHKHRSMKLVRNVYFNEVPEKFRLDKQRDDKHLNLIFAGGIIRVRGIDKVVRVLDVFKKGEVIFKLIGKFNDLNYRREITSLPGFHNVEMVGWQPHEMVIEEMAKADVGILTLLLDEVGLPNKMFEYMVMGLPIIASDSPGWSKIIKENKCGIIIDLMNPADIEKGIRFMIENPQARMEMGQNSRRVVMEKYKWTEDRERLLGLYKELFSAS